MVERHLAQNLLKLEPLAPTCRAARRPQRQAENW